MPSDAESRSERNWRSVASRAPSGMLLINPILRTLLDFSIHCGEGFRHNPFSHCWLRLDGFVFKEAGIENLPEVAYRKGRWLRLDRCCCERLVEIGDDIVAMF